MYEIQRKVCHSNMGADGKLTLGGAIDFMQDCCSFQLDSEETLTKYFKETGTGMFLVYRQLDIKRMPEYSEDLIIRTWIFGLKNACGVRNTNIYDGNGQPLILSYAYGAFVNLTTGRPFRMPTEITDTVPMEPQCDMEYTDRKLMPSKGVEPEIVKAFTVPYYFIDDYGHMNNARYVTLAREYVPDDFKYQRVKVEYKTQAKLGASLIPAVYRNDGTVTVSLNDEKGKAYSIVEFGK